MLSLQDHPGVPVRIETSRAVLRPFVEADLPAFAALHADAEVMWDYGSLHTLQQSREKLARYMAAYETTGFSRWAVEDRDGRFLGYTGPMPIPARYPLPPGFEIGWRFVRDAWGRGLATESSIATLTDFFARSNHDEMASYTAPDNLRSQAVMRRIGLARDATRDFSIDIPGMGCWHGLVWEAHRDRWRPPTPC